MDKMQWVPALSVEHDGRRVGGTSGAHGAFTWPTAVRAGAAPGLVCLMAELITRTQEICQSAAFQ